MQSVLQNLPVGWRFQPTNEELLDYYLKNKRLGLPIPGFDVEDIQIYDFEPWELIDKNSRSKERYLFCRGQFYQKTGGIQRKRKTKAGFWKRTGEVQSITREDSDEVIGTKKIFVYHDPKPTDFVQHEYQLREVLDSPIQDDFDFVLCKLMINKKKKASKKSKIVNSKKEGVINSKKIEVNFRNKEERISKKPRKVLSDGDKDSTNFRMHSDYFKNSEEISRNSMFETGNQSTATLENHYPNDSTIILHDKSSTVFENQNLKEIALVSPNKTVGISYAACISQYDATLYLDYNNSNELGYPITFESENQNPNGETNISASLERSRSLLQETTLDFGKQNRCEKTDISNLCDLGEDAFPEISSQMLDELMLYDDLLDTLSSEPT